MKWEELPLADRAQLMAAAVRNGYTDIRSIKAAYANFQNQKQQTGNRYDEGGDIDNDDIEVVNVLDEHPVWKALENIDYETVADPEFTREKTGAGSIEYFSAEEPEGITYNNGYHRDHPMPGRDVILYNPNDNDEQDIRLDALHIMPKDPTYDALNTIYRNASWDAKDDNYINAKGQYTTDKVKQAVRYVTDKVTGKNTNDRYYGTDPFIQYFNNEADATLRSLLMEGDENYRTSKRYWGNKDEVREWNAHLMPYVNDIQRYLETGERPPYVLPNLEVTNQKAYGGNLFKTGGNKGKKSKASSSQNSTLNYIAQQLEKRGVPKADALAVAANIMVESKGNPEAVNPISGAKGLVQYLGSRKKKVKSWAMDDQLDQIAATYNKLGVDEWLDKNAWKRFNETTDVAEKARLFRRYWERPEKSSWNDTDKYLGKHSNLPQEVNDLVAQVSSLKYNEPMAPVFTLTDQKLLETSPLVTSDPDYPDPKDNTFVNPYYEAVKLDSSLDRESSPLDQYFMLTGLMNSAQQDDNSSWFDTLLTYSPRVTPKQKEAAGIYRLFNTSGEGGQLYHGLNFAAYGGKVNRFDSGGRIITIGELPEAYVRAHGNIPVVTPAGNRTTLFDAYKNYNQTLVNTDDVPGLTDYLIKQDQPDISEQAHLDKVAADREIRQRNNIINDPIFDKEKIYNRVPGDMWQAVISDENNQSVEANRGITGSLLGYYFNPDNAVESRLQRYEKYKDLSMEEVTNAGIEFDRMWDKYGLDSIRNNPILSRKMAELESKMRAPYILQHEDAKDLYLGLPQRNNTMKDAEYSPTNGNLRNGKYIPYMRDPAFVNNVIMPSYNHLKRNFVDKEWIKRGLYKDHSYNMDISLVKEITPRGYARVEFPFLNNATLSGGIDPQRGEYASIFDTWDYNTNIMRTPGDNVGKYIGGEPFDIYDRYYLDDYYGINSKPQDNGYYGGYLPELFIVNKKALGGYLFGDEGQLYHGLNFAAYGGKVNRFDEGGDKDVLLTDEDLEGTSWHWDYPSGVHFTDPLASSVKGRYDEKFLFDENQRLVPKSTVMQYINSRKLPNLVHTFNNKDQYAIDVAKKLWGNNRFYAYRDLSDHNSGFFTDSFERFAVDEPEYLLSKFSPNDFLAKLDTLTQHSTTPMVLPERLHLQGTMQDGSQRSRAYTLSTIPGAPIFLDANGTNFLDDYLSEFAHTYQSNVKDKDIKDLDPRGHYGGGYIVIDNTLYHVPFEDTYRIPGSTEFNAHGPIENFIKAYLFYNDNNYHVSKRWMKNELPYNMAPYLENYKVGEIPEIVKQLLPEKLDVTH